MDTPVPSIKFPTLIPSVYVPKSFVEKIYNKTRSAINTFADWITNYILQEPKKIVNDKLEALRITVKAIIQKFYKNKFEIRESKSALRGFAKQYTIDGVEGIDAMSFLSRVKHQVLCLFEKNRMNKINKVLTCTMERIDIRSGENITNDALFRSKTEIVLSGTDVDELYKKTTNKCLESMAHY